MDDLPTPTEQHSKFALKMMLDNLTPEQRKAYEANGRFTVHLQGKTYLISRIADDPMPAYDVATIESEIGSLNLNRFSNGFKQALQETIARWRGEIEARGVTRQGQPRAQMNHSCAVCTAHIGVGVVIPPYPIPPHPFAKRNKP